MVHSGAIERFDPSKHVNHEEYVQQGKIARETDLRIHFVLNSLFTGLVHSFQRKLTVINNMGIYIPPMREEDEPILYSKSHYGPEKKFTTVRGEPFGEFTNAYETNPANIFFLTIRVPVGKYGHRLAYSTANAAQCIYTLVKQLMPVESAQVHSQYKALIDSETEWENPLKTMMEAAQTTAASFSILSPQKVANLEAMQLYRLIVESNVMDRLGRNLPLGYVFPMASSGHFHPDPLKFNRFTGKLDLSDDFVSYMKHHKELSLREGPGRQKERKLGCPLARENTPIMDASGVRKVVASSGIRQFANIMLPYIEYFYNHPDVVKSFVYLDRKK